MKKKIISTLLATMLMFNSTLPIVSAVGNIATISAEEDNIQVESITENSLSLKSLSITSSLDGVTSDVSLDKPFNPFLSSYTVDVLSQTDTITIDAVATDSNHIVEIISNDNDFIVNGSTVTLGESTWSPINIKVTNSTTNESTQYLLYIKKDNYVSFNGEVEGINLVNIDSSGFDTLMSMNSPVLNVKLDNPSSYAIYFDDSYVLTKDLKIVFTNYQNNSEVYSLFFTKGTSLNMYIELTPNDTINNTSLISINSTLSASSSNPITLKYKTNMIPEIDTNRVYLYSTSNPSNYHMGTIDNDGYVTFTFYSSVSGNYVISTVDQTSTPTLPDADAPTLKSLEITSTLDVPDSSKFDTKIDLGTFYPNQTIYYADILMQTKELNFNVVPNNTDHKVEIYITGMNPIINKTLSLDVPTDSVSVNIKVIDNTNVNNYTIYNVVLDNKSNSYVQEDGTVLCNSSAWNPIDETGLAVAMNMSSPFLSFDGDVSIRIPTSVLEKDLEVYSEYSETSIIIPANKKLKSYSDYYSNSSINLKTNVSKSSYDDYTVIYFDYESHGEYYLDDKSKVTLKVKTNLSGDGEVYIYQASTFSTNYQEKIVGNLENGIATFEIDHIPTTGMLHIIKPDESTPKLKSLSIDGVIFDKTFDPYVQQYQATISSQADTLKINAIADSNITITTSVYTSGSNDMPDTTKVNTDGSITLCPYVDTTYITLKLTDENNATNEYKLVIDKPYYVADNGDVFIGSSYYATIEQDGLDVALKMSNPTLNVRTNRTNWLEYGGAISLPANVSLINGLQLNIVDNLNDKNIMSFSIPKGKTLADTDDSYWKAFGYTSSSNGTEVIGIGSYNQDFLTDGSPITVKVKTDLDDGDIWLKMNWSDLITATIENGYIVAGISQGGYYSVYQNDGTDPFETPDVPTIIENLPTNTTVYKVGEIEPTPLSVIATANGNLSYEWYSNTNDSVWGGTLVSTDETYTPPTNTLGTTYYYCIVKNTLNNESKTIYSNVAEVVVVTPTTVESDGSLSLTGPTSYIDEMTLLQALESNNTITITGTSIENIILPQITSDKSFSVQITDITTGLTYTWEIPSGSNAMASDLNLALTIEKSATHVETNNSYFDPDPTSSEVIAFAHNGEMSSTGLSLTVETTVSNGNVWLYKLDEYGDITLNTEMNGNVINNTLNATIKNCSNWVISSNRLIKSSSSSSMGSVSNSSTSSNGNYISTNYYNSGSISIPSIGYIAEFRNVFLNELINLDKIDVNGMEILGWYYDADFTMPVENTSMFVVTQDVLDNGLYPKFATTVSDTLIDGSINAGYVDSSTNTSYIPSAVPSTIVKILSNLF